MPDHSDTVLRTPPGDGTSFRVVSLFTGIGGLDLGLRRAGHRIIQMSENWTPATRVLRSRFPDVPLTGDVREFRTVEGYDLLTAGFPCTDLSQAGRQRGIFGPASGLVREVFRIVEETAPEWILLENVPNLLRLGRGAGIAYIVDRLASLGYSWAYRVLDSRFTGLPQRRRRVFIVASRSGDPASVLLAGDTATAETPLVGDMQPHGFYWTEGRRGAGVVANAVPTLKGGSTLGLPSAPAIWLPTADVGSRFVLPHAAHGEVLQGFAPGWTEPAVVGGGSDHRWKLIGNAVTVDVAAWLGTRLSSHRTVGGDELARIPLDRSRPWPDAAFGTASGQWRSTASDHPVRARTTDLAQVLAVASTTPLSARASAGFLRRVRDSGTRIDPRLLADLHDHERTMRQNDAVPSSAVR